MHLAGGGALQAQVALHVEGPDHRLQEGGVPRVPLDAVIFDDLRVLGDVVAVADHVPSGAKVGAGPKGV